jgi:single-strand selective monofunctional uracil DNA glycosylase
MVTLEPVAPLQKDVRLIADELKTAYQDLARAIDGLAFGPPTSHVYNPLDYARGPAERYLDLAGGNTRQCLLLGMNPGPWGMAQTGVPFGTVSLVRDWLGIAGPVGKPPDEHPRRPIRGFAIDREEVSGSRLWGWARDRFETPECFFERFFVANYCPLVFMEASGRNRTPDKLPAAEKSELFRHCDRALRRVVNILDPGWVVGVGKFAEDRARSALAGLDVRIGRILHPSPASPAANRGWPQQAEGQLAALGIGLGCRRP